VSCAVAAFYILLVAITAFAQGRPAIESVGVCELVNAPDRYHGRIVQVHGRVHPAIIDTPIALADSTCAKSIRVDIERIAEADKDRSYRDFTRNLRELRTVEATISGRFEMVLVPSEEPVFIFRLLGVAEVTPGSPLFRLRRKAN
jgi:hypothetical protein